MHLVASDLRQREVRWHAEPPMPAQRVFSHNLTVQSHGNLAIEHVMFTIGNGVLNMRNGLCNHQQWCFHEQTWGFKHENACFLESPRAVINHP